MAERRLFITFKNPTKVVLRLKDIWGV